MVKITVPLLISSLDGVYVGARILGLENEPEPLVDHPTIQRLLLWGLYHLDQL